MTPLQLVHLTALMQRTSGSPTVRIGLIDGHVAARHPDLTSERLIGIPGTNGAH